MTSPSATPPGCAAAPDFRFPDGESLLDQQQRVSAALQDIHRVGPLPALAVCHGGSIRVMLCLRRPPRAGRVPRVQGAERGGGIAVRRLPVAAFVALVIATVGAFFVTQHLKVTHAADRGITRRRARRPSTPSAAGRAVRKNHLGVRVPVSFRRTRISFYLLHRADDVDVYIVDQDGVTTVDTLASGRHMAINSASSSPGTGGSPTAASPPMARITSACR